jgi:hypothetical protein
MLQLHALGQLADRCFPACRQSLDRKEQLVLLRLNTAVAGSLFTEVEETPYLVSQLGKSAVLLGREVRLG